MHGGIRTASSSVYGQSRWILGAPAVWRGVIVLAALAIIFWRTPSSFTNPQFWGEDIHFFYGARIQGWSSVTNLIAGYLTSIQYLVAVLASYLDPVFAPTIYNYTAVVLALLVVWLVTSPRLEMPLKPLLAVAVVIVPMAYEEIGTLCNIQWILPIGAFAILFMRSSNSRIVLTGEVIFIGLMSLSGPFSIFLAPLFAWRLYFAEPSERNRLFLLTAVVGVLGLAQALVIITHPYPIDAPAAPYPRSLWITLPLKQVMTTFGRSATTLFVGFQGAAIGAICLAVAAALACFPPYRTQKIFMLLLSAAIAVGGMVKFRDLLGTQVGAQRYFYAAAVFSLWFICCLSSRPRIRALLAASVTIISLTLLPIIKDTPRIGEDLEWPVWAGYISSGIPVIIPTSPPGWYVGSPPASGGPLAKFNSWVGRSIADLAKFDAGGCDGSIDSVKAANSFMFLDPSNASGRPAADWWSAEGVVRAGDAPIKVLAITDAAGKVLGFGLPGFHAPGVEPPQTAWKSVFHSRPGAAKAFGILDDGKRACQLTGAYFFSGVIRNLASDQFSAAIGLTPGKTVVQRFKPAASLQGVSLRFVNFGSIPNSYPIDWQIDATIGGKKTQLGSGKLSADTIRDWGQRYLSISAFPEEIPDLVEVSVHASGDGTTRPAGIPLYQAGNDGLAAEVDGVPVPGGLQLGLAITYSK